MLRPTILAVALLASAAQAQDAPSATSGPTAGQRVLLVAGALGGGYLTAVSLPPLAPLGVAAATYGTGALLGLDTPFRRVVVDAAIGTGVGYVAGLGMMGYFVYVEGLDADLSTGLGSAAFGLTVGAIVTALQYDGQRVLDVAPAALRQPGGIAHGVAVQIGL